MIFFPPHHRRLYSLFNEFFKSTNRMITTATYALFYVAFATMNLV